VSADTRPSRLAQVAPVLAALLAVAVLIGYVRTGFLLDDAFLLARAAHRFSFEVLDFALRTTDYRIHLWVHEDPVVFHFFRPLCSLSLWIEHRFWGTNAWGYHLTNVILHLANAWMLWRLAIRCGLGRGTALLGALAWALSIQTIPSAGWISGRTEVLWCSCMLIAIHALLRWRDGGGARWFGASLVASGLAACAKESGLVTPLLGLLTVWQSGLARPGEPSRASRACSPRSEKVPPTLERSSSSAATWSGCKKRSPRCSSGSTRAIDAPSSSASWRNCRATNAPSPWR